MRFEWPSYHFSVFADCLSNLISQKDAQARWIQTYLYAFTNSQALAKKKKTKKTQAASKSVQIEFENGRSPTYFAYVGFSDRNWLLFLFRLQLLMAVSLEFSQNGKMVMVKKKKKMVTAALAELDDVIFSQPPKSRYCYEFWIAFIRFYWCQWSSYTLPDIPPSIHSSLLPFNHPPSSES